MLRLAFDRIRRADSIDPVFLDTPQYESPRSVMCWAVRSPSRSRRSIRFGGARPGIPVIIVVARLLGRRIAADQGLTLIEDSLDLATATEPDRRARAARTRCTTRHPGDLPRRRHAGQRRGARRRGARREAIAPHVEIIAAQPAAAPALTLCWRSGAVVDTDTIDTIADGAAGGCPIPEVLDDLLVLVDDVMLVGEAANMTGMRLLLQHAGVVVEPSAALGIASILQNRERFAERRVATILYGSNVITDNFAGWARGQRMSDERRGAPSSRSDDPSAAAALEPPSCQIRVRALAGR